MNEQILELQEKIQQLEQENVVLKNEDDITRQLQQLQLQQKEQEQQKQQKLSTLKLDGQITLSIRKQTAENIAEKIKEEAQQQEQTTIDITKIIKTASKDKKLCGNTLAKIVGILNQPEAVIPFFADIEEFYRNFEVLVNDAMAKGHYKGAVKLIKTTKEKLQQQANQKEVEKQKINNIINNLSTMETIANTILADREETLKREGKKIKRPSSEYLKFYQEYTQQQTKELEKFKETLVQEALDKLPEEEVKKQLQEQLQKKLDIMPVLVAKKLKEQKSKKEIETKQQQEEEIKKLKTYIHTCFENMLYHINHNEAKASTYKLTDSIQTELSETRIEQQKEFINRLVEQNSTIRKSRIASASKLLTNIKMSLMTTELNSEKIKKEHEI